MHQAGRRMKKNLSDFVVSLRQRLTTALSWSTLRGIGNSRIVQISAIMPFVGYAIVYSDVVERLYCRTWSNIFTREPLSCSINSSFMMRLHLLYTGLFMLGLGSLIFNYFCPKVVRRYPDATDFISSEANTTSDSYLEFMLDVIKIWSMRDLYRLIEAFEPINKLYNDIEKRKNMKVLPGSDLAKLISNNRPLSSVDLNLPTPENSRAKLELMDTFYYASDKNVSKKWLWVCFMVFSIGFLMLFLPSASFFVRVIYTISGSFRQNNFWILLAW